jgi:retron-type reverse transcriptase
MELAGMIIARTRELPWGQRIIIWLAIAAVILIWILSAKKKRGGGFTPPPRRIVPPPPPPQGSWPPNAREVQSNLDRLRAVQAASTTRASTSTAPPPRPGQRGPAKLDLDAGQFKPVTDRQATAEARGLGNLWGNPWFGRRDLIPPPEDPRTNLIDRAMVGHGLITPEELVEIHTIGRQMDEIRPDLGVAEQAATQAVIDDRAERARVKEEKKKAAEERKRLHAEAVKRRKATDIVFLGRGVSKGLADRRSHVEKLQAAGLPVLSTPADVASALKLSIARLRFLAFHADATPVSHYVRFAVPKRTGGERWLAAPMPELAATQEWILVNILEKLPTHPAAHGFVIGRSTVTNASAHVKRDIIVNKDLRDFFPSITFRRVAGLFREIGYSPAVAAIFALLCTDAPRRKVIYAGKTFYVAAGPRALPQGACTSPAISNLVAKRLDSRLTGIASKLGWNYTRYADDLSLSASGEPTQKIGYMLARVRHIAQDEGFAVNETKTRVVRQSNRQLVTGVVVNQRPGIDRPTVRRLRAILHRAKFEGLRAQNREKIPHFEAWLSGMIAYVHMVNPRQAAPLRAALEKLTSS